MSAPLPTPIDCELLAWFAGRKSVRWANIPQHWRRRAHQLADSYPGWLGERWLERDTHVMVRATTTGRMIAAAYRAGRAAAPEARESGGEPCSRSEH